jgi:hypothetical protein
MSSIPSNQERLLLPEELFLIALKPNGTIYHYAARVIDPALAAAILLELTLRERVQLVDNVLVCNDARWPMGDELLDQVLRQISESSENGGRSVTAWLPALWAGDCRWRDRMAARLVERGVLKEHGRTALTPFLKSRCELVDRASRASIASRVRGVLLGDEESDVRTKLLASLVYSCGLTRDLVPRRQRRAARKRGKALGTEHWASQEVAQAAHQVAKSAASQIVRQMAMADFGGGGF